MTIIVTGAAGFIGSNIVKALNQRGITDIVAVDNLSKGEKFKTLPSVKLPIISINTNLSVKCAAIFGLTTISKPFSTKAHVLDTMNHDGLYMMDNNYQYTLDLLTGVRMNASVPFMLPAP